MTTARRNQTEPLEREKAVALMAGAAADIDAVYSRVVRRLEKLQRGKAEQHLIDATHDAAVALVRVAKALRRDGYLGHAKRARKTP